MIKPLMIALALVAGALFNTADAAGKKKKDKKRDKAPMEVVTLDNAADSLSYAAGMVRTDGLVPYLTQSLGVDTAYMADFIQGYEDAVAKGFDGKLKAYYAGEQIALMVSQRMLPFLKEEFAGRPDSINEAAFNRGFVNALKGDHAMMADSTAKAYFDKAFKQAVDDRNAANKKAGEDFLAANKQKPGVVTLPNDEVTVKYEGRLVDGTVFDSSYERKEQTNKFRPSQVIKGWAEALTMMPAGSKWELYIPYDLAYGERAAGKIKPYSALVFTVELVSVNKAKAAGQGAAAKAGPATVKAAKIRPAKTSASKAQPNK